MYKVESYEELKELIDEMTDNGVILFENPDYYSAFIGISHDDAAIYDYELMVEYLIRVYEMEAEEAIEFIDFNTIRVLDYWDCCDDGDGDCRGKTPIIMFPF